MKLNDKESEGRVCYSMHCLAIAVHGVRCPRPEVRATCIALFLFCMNQVGGNLPVLVTALEPLLGGYR